MSAPQDPPKTTTTKTTRDERVALARKAIVGSGSLAVVVTALRSLAESNDIEPSEVFGDLDNLTELWLTDMSEAWADIFPAKHLAAVIEWNATEAATAMREKQQTIQALGERIMERCIARNKAGGAL